MNKKQKIIAAFLTLFFVISCVGCSKSDNTEKETAKANKKLFTIRVATPTSFSELFVADELGFFKEEGINLKFIGPLGKGVTEIQLLQQGLVDSCSGHPPTIAQARLAGIKVIAVAPGIVDDPKLPHVTYLAKDGSNIKSLSDVGNKKVSIGATGPCYDGYITYYLIKKNLKNVKPEFITLSTPGQQEQSVLQGLVDLTTSHPPYAGKALAAGGVHVVATSWDILHSPGAGLSVRGFKEDFIKAHPKVVQGYVNALYKARLWINANPNDAKIINAKYLNLKPSDLTLFKFDEEKNINPKYIKEWYKIAETIGTWKHGDIKETAIYTNKFVPKDYNPANTKYNETTKSSSK